MTELEDRKWRDRERDGQTERKSRGKGMKEKREETCKDRRERERERSTLHPVGVRALRSYKCGFVSSFTGQSNGLR